MNNHGCSLSFQMAGMGVLGFAIWMRMDQKVNFYARASYKKPDDINSYYIMCYVLMGAGALMTFVGFLGCCGAFQESRCMLGTVSMALTFECCHAKIHLFKKAFYIKCREFIIYIPMSVCSLTAVYLQRICSTSCALDRPAVHKGSAVKYVLKCSEVHTSLY